MEAPNKAIDALEWKRFLEYAESEARTQPGKTRVRALLNPNDPSAWAPDVATARLLQQETQEVTALLGRDALWGPLMDLPDPEPQLDRLGRGAVLEITDLAILRRWIYAIDSWTQTPREEIRGELFKKALGALADPFEPLRVLERVLSPEGELSEKASPKLSAIYSDIRSLKREIATVLDHLLKTFSQKGVLQEQFSDVRDGRYVIPIKISSQGEVDGIIYEASVSRQTVFVEPKEISPLNNRLRQRQNDLIQEIFAVLSETSKQLKPFAEELKTATAVLSHWDGVQARARIGRHYAGKAITVTEERRFYLEQTAHPLLWHSLSADQIVRNQIDFGSPVRTLLITGPNTGGKTVLLKTLGLAGFCARTGFPFPGTGNIVVPFFDSIFADLGDSQSIEQHLSSFSGHVLKFKEILEEVTDRSLVLIDELNSATDPEEGAALGRAFLETIMARDAITVSTTHDPHLKAMAISDRRILNASMEFDENSRLPTFQLVLGVPGRSRALETAERLGIPESVLTLAKSYLSREHAEFEKTLAKLEKDSQEASRARKDAVILRVEAERLKKEWTTRTESSVNEMLDRTRQKLRRILEQAQDEVRSSVRKLDEMRNRKDIDQTRSQINETFTLSASRVESALHEEAPELAQSLTLKTLKEVSSPTLPTMEQLQPGTQVRVPKWKSTGTILELKGDHAKVAMGTIQMSLSLKDIEPLLPSEKTLLASVAGHKTIKKGKISHEADLPPAPPSQLDLRGVRLDDAMSDLERYLDQAFRSGALSQVTIIHGLGTGALREGTRKLLKELPYVKTFRDGGIGQGGTGATIVELDRD